MTTRLMTYESLMRLLKYAKSIQEPFTESHILRSSAIHWYPVLVSLVSVELFRSVRCSPYCGAFNWRQQDPNLPETCRHSTATATATAGGLTVGARYILCVDLDGDGPLPLGPTGVEAWWILVDPGGCWWFLVVSSGLLMLRCCAFFVIPSTCCYHQIHWFTLSMKAAKGPSMPLKRTGLCNDSDICSAFHHQCCSWTTLEFDLRCRSLADTPLILSIMKNTSIIPNHTFQCLSNISKLKWYSWIQLL